MPDIDHDALSKATKVLCVLFIVIVCCINAFLIFIVARKPRFVSSPWCLMLISLSIADIFLALFSLVVNARLTYEHTSLPFGTNLTAQYYQTFIISFVYGVGLILMAVELILRHRRLTPFLKRYLVVVAFAFSALPWLVMLVIDLPLILSDVNWEKSQVEGTPERSRAKIWVSVLVPAILAVVICLVITFINLEPVMNTPETGYRLSTRFLATSHERRFIPDYNHHHVQQYHQRQTINNYHTSQHATESQHPNNHPADVTFQTPTLSTTNAVSEKCVLLFVALIYFICVVPQAALFVSDSKISVRIFLILLHSFYWICNFRSILTPAIWVFYCAEF
ncbi:unnamed protein product [Candidula unifasciata]|uniref:G-protein coupled receptors family 1 profile domain-containing protein n=1 Tax=Candidula unifasciata TaxID=100452 RepID=A0A8S3Z3A7_9EUPU|nr:unnamed protein product [Candidula unifasciata]